MSKRSEGRALPTATSNRHKPAGNWAAGVSRTLRKGGLRSRGGSDPSSAQDLRVKAGEVGQCTIVADFDQPRVAEQMITAAAEVLTAAGYTTKRADIDGTIEGDVIRRLVVTRPVPPKPQTTPGGRPAPTWKRRPKDILGEVTYEHRHYPGWNILVDGAGFTVRMRRRTDLPEQPFSSLDEATQWIETHA